MRIGLSIIFIILVAALTACAFMARRSSKQPIGTTVSVLLVALIPPVIGNLLIIDSANLTVATIGYYIYFLGMDLVMFALLRFTFDYCNIKFRDSRLKFLIYALLVLDALQLLANPFFGHAFTTEAIMAGGGIYHNLVALTGQAIHRIIDYSIFGSVLVLFLVKCIRAPRIYAEKYYVILAAMVFGGLWQTFYIFSRTPIDRSMIGFGVFGLLVYYFAMRYRPLRLLDGMLARIVSDIPEAVFFFDGSGKCIWVNSLGKTMFDLEDGENDKVPLLLTEKFGSMEHARDDWTDENVVVENDERRYYKLSNQSLKDKKNNTIGSFLRIQDNTEYQIELRREKFNATHDKLTGLMNKEYLYESIEKVLEEDSDTIYMVGFINVSDFKLVNDIYGNDFGDYALQCISEWIRITATENMLYGRLAGDTFGVFLPKDEFNHGYVEKILSEFVIEDEQANHHILMHLGLYEINETDIDVSAMFDRARMAVSTIKSDYQIHIAYYDEEMREHFLWNQYISAQLPKAINEGQIKPYLQPMVDTKGNVVGAEALARWDHPEYGFLSPASFIPVFETNGMIAEVDRYIWRCACEILKKWKEEGIGKFISVNISPKDFYFMDVAQELKDIVKEYGVDPAQLRIEITETVMMTDNENRIKILNDLKAEGFIIEMDDFGSGYSSLNLLKDMPVDVIKIDMMFLKKTANQKKAEKILQNIIQLSNEINMESLTEGVENESQYNMLTEMGCQLFQGFYFAKPMPVEEFENYCQTA